MIGLATRTVEWATEAPMMAKPDLQVSNMQALTRASINEPLAKEAYCPPPSALMAACTSGFVGSAASALR